MLSISIITVVRNGARTIEDCLRSVQSQAVKAELIVVDGVSTDGTLDILNSRRTELAHLLSEPDRGMYDALNKGIGLAKGSVIGLLHADDIFANGSVLSRVVEVLDESGADSCYGDLEYIDSNDADRTVRRWRAGPFRPSRHYWGWMPPHPTFFARREVYERLGTFRLDLGTAADYELMLRFLLKHRISATYIPEVLVRMRVGGKSTASLGARLRANRMDRKAWTVNGLRPYPWTIPMKPIRKLPQFVRGGLLWSMLMNRGG